MASTLVFLLIPGAVVAKSPAPEFAVQSALQEHLARKFADQCDEVTFDHAGYDRHFKKLLAQYSDMGIHYRTISKRFAPIPTYRYQRHIDKFNREYGLNETSTLADFCEVAVKEAKARSAIGQMLN